MKNNKKNEKKKVELNAPKVARNLEKVVKDLNFHFVTEKFTFEDIDDKKRIVFKKDETNSFLLYEMDRKQEEWEFDRYNLGTIKSNAKDKLNSWMFKGKIKPFEVKRTGQVVVIFIPGLQGKKGIILDPCRFSDEALVQLGNKEKMIKKEFLGVVG